MIWTKQTNYLFYYLTSLLLDRAATMKHLYLLCTGIMERIQIQGPTDGVPADPP